MDVSSNVWTFSVPGCILRLMLMLLLALPLAAPSPATLEQWSVRSAAIEQQVMGRPAVPTRGPASILVEPVAGSPISVSNGLIHHWKGSLYVMGVRVPQVVQAMQRYDDLARYYSPDVVESKLLAHDGDHYRVLLRMREHEVITARLSTIAEVHYGGTDKDHQWSISHIDSVRDESGEDHGFLWRMNTYWHFTQQPDGVVLECEVVSLTRDVPTGLNWLIRPFLRSIPEKSLRFTLERTKQMLMEAHDGNRRN